LPAKGTGEIGDLIISMIDIWGLALWCVYGIFITGFPNFRCDRMVGAAGI